MNKSRLDLRLYTIPETHIWDLKIETKLEQIEEEEAESAEIILSLKIFGNGSINAEVLRERKRVTRTQRIFEGENEIRISMKRVKLWSAEHPDLYTMRLKVYDELGKNMEIIEEKIGFRQFEIKNCLMLINGKRIVFNGVNRQEFSSSRGRNMTEEQIEEFLKVHRDKPFICCEYLHAMGNSCGAMHKYIDLTESEPLYQGGFIWDYIDQVIEKKNRYGEIFQAYGGDCKERATDYNFSGNGIVYGDDRKPSPKMQEVKFHYQGITVKVGKLKAEIINKNLFTNTEEYDCIVTLEREGKLISLEKMETAVAPLSRKKYILPIKPCEMAGEYCITVSFRLKEDTIWAKRGHEVAFGQCIYKNEGRVVEQGRYKSLTVQKSSVYAGVHGEDFSVLFSLLEGGVVSYKYDGKELLESMPRPNFWRTPTDNELGCDMPFETGQWKLARQYLKPVNKKLFIEEYKEFVQVKFLYELPIGVGGDDSWGAKVHKEYLIDATKEMSFSFSIKGI